MSNYTDMINRQQGEVNTLPIRFAFGNQQFEQMMKNWRLDPERDMDKIYCLQGGGFIQKKDYPLLHEMMARHNQERREAIAADKTGNGFIYQMFLTELTNHEYVFTGDAEDTLDALGLTWEQVQTDKRMNKGFNKAVKKIIGRS